ncbi:MAG: DUF4190 domain-containing protein [Ktedonobacterales bacterium]
MAAPYVGGGELRCVGDVKMTEPATAASDPSAGGLTQARTDTATGGATSSYGSSNVPPGPAPYPAYPYPPNAPYSYPPYPYPNYANSSQPTTSGWASVSMACGIAGLLGADLIGSILAIIFGHISINEIKRSGDVTQGRGFATARFVTGYIGWIMLSASYPPQGLFG